MHGETVKRGGIFRFTCCYGVSTGILFSIKE